MDERLRDLAKKFERTHDVGDGQRLAHAVLQGFRPEHEMRPELEDVHLGLDVPIERWHVYSYAHVDFYFGFRDPDELVARDRADQLTAFLAALRARLIRGGWEGDGELEVIWLPPFVLGGDTYGLWVWHVKQSNNGTSWIASTDDLPFEWLDRR